MITAPEINRFVGSVAPHCASPFCGSALIRTPANMPATGPLPPIRLLPPMTEAAIAGSSSPMADGAGDMNPNAEFNSWVDPEAARGTRRSGIPVELSPLIVSRKSALTKQWLDKMVAIDTPLTRQLKDTMGPRFAGPA